MLWAGHARSVMSDWVEPAAGPAMSAMSR